MPDADTLDQSGPGLQQLSDWLDQRSGKISFVSGNFNNLHPGHLRMLRFAAEVGPRLVVGVTRDDTPGVTVPCSTRMESFRSLAVDLFPVALHCTPEEFIGHLRPDFVVKGKEHEESYNPEKEATERYGGKLLFSSGETRFSSIATLRRESSETRPKTLELPTDYAERHGFDKGHLKRILASFAGLRVTVVGDLIVDEYIDCSPLGMSREDPTIVVAPIDQATFIGGSVIVAAHARSLGADVDYFSIVGADDTAGFARSELSRYGVGASLLVDPTRPTTRKQRFRASGKTLLRVNHLRQHAIDRTLADKLVAAVMQQLAHTDLLLFSDFNYGCLPQGVVDTLIAAATEKGVMMAADSQASSQISNISRYRGMALVTPTEREARLALSDLDSGLVVLAERLANKASAANVLITLGAEGMIVHAASKPDVETDRLPAFNNTPKDVAGAGDSLFACVALAHRAGADIWSSAYLGSLAAACQVSRVGNIPQDPEELLYELDYTPE